MSFIFTLCKVDFTQSIFILPEIKKMQTVINILKKINFGPKTFTLAIFLVIPGALVAEDYKPIPLDKLVCYGQGTQQQLSPSGEFLAAMVPVDENVCDIKDETDQEMMATDRVLVVTNLETMEPKVISGTTVSYTHLTLPTNC